jgi:hypothetical protein
MGLTQGAAWDSWRRRGRIREAATAGGRSIVPLSLMLVFAFLGVGFVYGITGTLYPQSVDQSQARNVNFFYQAVVPKDEYSDDY